MKKCYIIFVDLKTPLLNRVKMITGIQSAQIWARLNDNTFIISTELSAEQIRDALLKLMYQGDKIYISLLGNSAAWYGLDQQVSNWIRENQK
jgi:hypothetical protein